MQLWQYIAAGLSTGAALGVVLAAPHVAGTVALLVTATLFFGVTAFRTFVLVAAVTCDARAVAAAGAPVPPGALPTYCVRTRRCSWRQGQRRN